MVTLGGIGRSVSLKQGSLPFCCWEQRTLRGPWSESQPYQDVPSGTVHLHLACRGGGEGCLEVAWVGPSSGGLILEELGLSTGLGSLCLVYVFKGAWN